MGGWRRLREHAGTHLLEKCCHDMDIALWLADSLPVRVASFGGLNFFRPENVGHTRRDEQGREVHTTWNHVDLVNPFTAEKDIVDNQVVILEYANGVRASFHANCSSGIPERRICLIGTEGALRADALSGIIEVQRISSNPEMQRFDTNVAGGHPGGHAGGDEVLVESLHNSMRTGAAPLVGVEEGIKSAVVCFAIDEAMDTGKVVDLRPIWKRVKPCALDGLHSRREPQ
jgi:predicted dehydrogenase